jgi:hypothetical protein
LLISSSVDFTISAHVVDEVTSLLASSMLHPYTDRTETIQSIIDKPEVRRSASDPSRVLPSASLRRISIEQSLGGLPDPSNPSSGGFMQEGGRAGVCERESRFISGQAVHHGTCILGFEIKDQGFPLDVCDLKHFPMQLDSEA